MTRVGSQRHKKKNVKHNAMSFLNTVPLLKISTRLSTSVAVMSKALLNLGCSYIDAIIFNQPGEVFLFCSSIEVNVLHWPGLQRSESCIVPQWALATRIMEIL
jgi:hypothetical protein